MSTDTPQGDGSLEVVVQEVEDAPGLALVPTDAADAEFVDDTDEAEPADLESDEALDFGEVGDATNHTFVPRHPVTGVLMKGTSMLVAGEDTKHYREVLAEAQKRQGKRIAKDMTFLTNNTPQNLDVLVGVVLSWEGVLWKGEQMECTEKNKRLLFSSRAWVAEQLKAFLNNRQKRMGK